MREAYRTASVLLLGMICLCAVFSLGILLWPERNSALLERVLSAGGVFLTSTALILAGYFAVLAVSAYGHVTRVRQTTEKALELAEKTQKAAAKAREAANASSQALRNLSVRAIDAIDTYTTVMAQAVWSSIATIEGLPTSPAFPADQRDKLTDSLRRATDKQFRSRAKIVLQLSYDPSEILTQLKTVYAIRRAEDIPLVQQVRRRWATHKEIRELCIVVEKHLRQYGV